MFVRVKKRTNQRRPSLAFFVVSSTRENGKPRQKVLCYLGCVPERLAAMPHIRRYLWRQASAALDRAGLSRRQRRAVECSLDRLCPKPTAADRREAAAMLARLENYHPRTSGV